MKKVLAALDAERREVVLAVLWLLCVQLLAMLAWQAGLLGRMDALLHWLVVGVMPPAMALLTTPPPPD